MLKLSEDEVLAGFEMYVHSCLQRAKREKLLDADTSNFDVAISGRALALFYATITAHDPPSIPIPPACELNPYTSPPSFAQFTSHWVKLVPVITSLPSQDKFDLARILCDREPLLSSSSAPSLNGTSITTTDDTAPEPRHDLTSLATELRSLAMKIEQRREFQRNFSGGVTLAVARKRGKSVVLPSRPISSRAAPTPPLEILPIPDPAQWQNHSAPSSPASGRELALQELPLNYLAFNPDVIARARPLPSLPAPQPVKKPLLLRKKSTPVPPKSSITAMTYHPIKALSPPPSRPSSSSGTMSRPSSSSGTNKQASGSSKHHHPRAASSSASSATSTIPTTFPTPPKRKPVVPLAILTIRETLYAAIAEVLSTYPRLRKLLTRDPARAYFSTIALAILSVSLSSLSSDGMSIRTVLGTDLSVGDMPADYPSAVDGGDYRSFIEELMGIGRQGRKMAEEDDERAVAYVARGRSIPDPRMDRLRWILEKGVGYVDESGKMRGEKSLAGREYGTTMLFALRINTLAMRVVKMKALFKDERGEEILNVLAGLPK